MFLADAVADPLTGLAAAAAVADLLERGGRWLVDVALSRVAALMADDEVVAALDDPSPPTPRRATGAPLPLGGQTRSVLAEFCLVR